jgi:hypothetical protein
MRLDLFLLKRGHEDYGRESEFARGGVTKMRKTIEIIFLIIPIFLIWGCEPKLEGSWLGPSGSVTDYRKDREECIKQAQKQAKETNENVDFLVSKCMQSKGYYMGDAPQ